MVAAALAAAGAAVAVVLALGLGAGGCFSPTFEACAVSCGEGNACPGDQVCLADGKCHASQDEELCSPGGGDASVDDGDDVDDTSDDPDDTSDDTADDLMPPDGGPPDASFPDAGVPVTPTESGQLVITEIHKNPVEVGDLEGEWFEVYNPTRLTFDMQGLRVSDFDGESFDITAEVIVPPGERVVLARRGDPDVNGGVPGVDFVYGVAFSLANSGDEILIENLDAGVLIDAVVFDPFFPDVEGVAMSLDPGAHDAIDNDSSKSWCDATTPYGAGDLGTPGSANPDC